MNILIVDDHPLNRKLLRVQLEAEGMTVCEAGDGLQAIAALERAPADAIISDVLMPNMDGYQLCHWLHNSERFRTAPCILYSNTFASDSSRQLALRFGADLFLKKPAPVAAIHAALHEVIQKRKRQPPGTAQADDVQHLRETQSYSEHLVRELERQNTELEELKSHLLDTNHKLVLRTKKLEEVEAELRQTNDGLERRVRMRTAELESANRELESFSYSVSHDLRAPLRAINGFSQLVLDRSAAQLDDASRHQLEHVVSATREMAQLIDDLLELSRVTRMEVQRRPLDLSALAQRVLDNFAQADAGRAVERCIQPDLRVDADPHLLEVVLTNLLGNAWKFTRKAARPRIEFGAGDTDGQRAYFVRDNGAGFDMKYAQKLFGAFQRMHRQEEFEGTGIGLSIVQRIIHRHGGRVWAEAELGKGAAFYFTVEGAAFANPKPVLPS